MRRLLPAAVALALLGLAAYVVLRPSPAPPATASAPPRTGETPQGGPRVTTKTGPGVVAVTPVAPQRPKGELVIHGKWGSGPGEFGHRDAKESNPEAPMAIAAGPSGQLAIVDQVNGRVQRFDHGKPAGTISLGGETAQDLTFGADGRTIVLDRLGDRNVQVYDRDGKLVNEASFVGREISEGGNATGVFTDEAGAIYVEREHGNLYRVADAGGRTDPSHAELPGRPTRDGRQLIAAALGDQAAGTVVVNAFDRGSGSPIWSATVPVGAPIQSLLLLDSDAAGSIYVAASTGQESPSPPFQIVDEAVVVMRLDPSGTPNGRLVLPPLAQVAETFRPLSVDDSGAVYEMVAGPNGLDVMRFAFQ